MDWFLISFLILIISISYLSTNSYISFSVIPLPFINIYPSLDVNYFPSWDCSCYYFSSSSSLSPLYVSPFIICLLSVFSSYLSTICTYCSFFLIFLLVDHLHHHLLQNENLLLLFLLFFKLMALVFCLLPFLKMH